MKTAILTALVVSCVVSCGPRKPVIRYPSVGDKAITWSDDASGVIFAASDDAAYKQMNQVVLAKDKHGYMQMANSGRLLILTNQTPVLVIDKSFTTTTIRILDGLYKGQSAITDYENIRAATDQ